MIKIRIDGYLMIEDAEINQAKAENIIEKIKKRIDNYDPMISSELQEREIQRDIKKAELLLGEARNCLEVEDFLLNGPKGKEPK